MSDIGLEICTIFDFFFSEFFSSSSHFRKIVEIKLSRESFNQTVRHNQNKLYLDVSDYFLLNIILNWE